jgi:O-antigen/teichoic acid export membrane protein
MKKTILLTIILSAFVVQPAFAYIDPGSGSAIMSAIIGFFVAIGVLIKTFWYKIKSFLGLSKNSKPNTESSNDSTDQN